jgi:type IV fimbrial biogenesis protein FimT
MMEGSSTEHALPAICAIGIDLQRFRIGTECKCFHGPCMEALQMKFSLKVDGYSLIEMLFMLFIVGVLCSTVALSFKGLQNRVHIQAASEALLSDVLSARAEALRLERRVTLCAAALDSSLQPALPTACASSGSSVAWHQGWLVFEDPNSNGLWDEGESLLKQRSRINPHVSATGNTTVGRYVSFGASGRSLLLNGAFQAGTITLCERGANAKEGWLLVVNAVGRARLEKGQIAICP